MIAWRRAARFGVPEVFALIGLLSFAVARFLPVLAVPYTCPMKGAFGIPCATCGMTHAFVALARGDVAAALAASPLGALLAAAAWLYAALDLSRAALDLPFPFLDLRLQRALVAIATLALAANWAWLLSHGSNT
ncbi:MAG TPA: DUF2752 domain-containing protein [Anaeromyxobacteraceae bacterium]|nr:DUF2752 domain-containing protein [Anaeromyxobacteraceae bacterium]